MTEDGWIEWGGGERPVPKETPVEVRFRNGVVDDSCTSDVWSWWHAGGASDIVAYRLLGTPPHLSAEEEKARADRAEAEVERLRAYIGTGGNDKVAAWDHYAKGIGRLQRVIQKHTCGRAGDPLSEIAADEIERLEKECFDLAANQCHKGYGDDYGNHRCKYQDEIERLKKDRSTQAAEKDGWIKWGGGTRPVPPYQIVDILERSGDQYSECRADRWIWTHTCGEGDIVAYRLSGPLQEHDSRLEADTQM